MGFLNKRDPTLGLDEYEFGRTYGCHDNPQNENTSPMLPICFTVMGSSPIFFFIFLEKYILGV